MVKPLLKKYVGSLWLREKARVFVSPGRIHLMRQKGKEPSTISISLSTPADWNAVCQGVANLVRDNLPSGSAIGIVLSNHWVRYITLPAGRGRLGRDLEVELARGMLVEQHGSGWNDAIVCIENGVPDEGVLAAAIRRVRDTAISGFADVIRQMLPEGIAPERAESVVTELAAVATAMSDGVFFAEHLEPDSTDVDRMYVRLIQAVEALIR